MNSWIDELTMASYESEIDLDRDVPDGPVEEPSYLDSLMTTGFDVDVDENGPFITHSLDEADDGICHYSGLPSVTSYNQI